MIIKKDKLYLFELKEKDKVTSPLLRDFYQEDMEVLEAAEDILSEDSEDSLQKTKDKNIINCPFYSYILNHIRHGSIA